MLICGTSAATSVCTVLNYTNEKVHALEIRLVLGTPELIYRSQNDGKVV